MKAVSLKRLPEGVHAGYGFEAVYDRSKRRWLLTGLNGSQWFLSLGSAKKFVEEWLDEKQPDWREKQREEKLEKISNKYHSMRDPYPRRDPK